MQNFNGRNSVLCDCLSANISPKVIHRLFLWQTLWQNKMCTTTINKNDFLPCFGVLFHTADSISTLAVYLKPPLKYSVDVFRTDFYEMLIIEFY